MWGECFSIGIDNHFQLLLYISENHCQLETKIFFEYFLRIVNKTHDYAILENKKICISY